MAKKKIIKKAVKKAVKNKKKIKNRIVKMKDEIKIDQLLLHSRQVMLSGVIDTDTARRVNSHLMALDIHCPRTPIVLWINSRGGSVYDGFAIIDCMNGLSSPVMTIVNGQACSMGGIISIFGATRYITKHSVWMAHDMVTGDYDYLTKVKDRIKNSEKLESTVMKMFIEKTKLTVAELELARHGELWLDAFECKQKGVVDEILN